MKKVWRFEHPEKGGIYWSGWAEHNIADDPLRHPVIPYEIAAKYLPTWQEVSPVVLFGFPSMKALRRWFNPQEIAKIKESGTIQLRCYRVPKVLWSDKNQCIFDKRSAKLVF